MARYMCVFRLLGHRGQCVVFLHWYSSMLSILQRVDSHVYSAVKCIFRLNFVSVSRVGRSETNSFLMPCV